ncbi:type III-B CRISPR module RAMP protein Cmr6 [Oculatella sp. FACHB-28]|uniref:RAMP superfamily CRISPR-associated protein n=1 Tax=Oculatella sp. FACHB-28 TaxID=2692845 RepID=UPI00168215C5|nr:RAMP superfamily CRISPR-associated protein [Oculatella sp. FACHB-28]MBD2054629.1 type III-B CRISPR module RAMP protein Cmr6 [Oculatella sp. FACHB-28]
MVFERPKRPGQPSPATNRPNPAIQRTGAGQPKKVISRGGGNAGGNRSGGNGEGGNGDGNRSVPSPWIEHPLDPIPNPHATASFVEYLRWMRSPDSQYKDPTKVQILQMAEENANYRDRLTQLTSRTKLIAESQKGTTFPVKCLWRIRVGGHRGPESILLPAFDALGMPYIPASTLRGVARTQAIRDLMAQENLSWKRAEEEVARKYFGFLDSKDGGERSGKVTFLDAYPIPQQSGNGGGLAVDMANNIWSWDASGKGLLYSPNPNPFFSLEEATFLIGICPSSNGNEETLEQVKQWLSQGLQSGIGSQVNTGYGSLIRAGQVTPANAFFDVEFTLEGQLIHGRQKFKDVNSPFQKDHNGKLRIDNKGNLKVDSSSHAEVRPVAFKSMLRYWFRVFALGVLPSREVQQLEATLFGAINPRQSRGWVTVRIADGRVVQREARPTTQGKDDPCGEQSGRLILACSSEAPNTQKRDIEDIFKALTWMMFHLGGIGQGARRPCYSRKPRERAPWWRGSTLIPDAEVSFWKLPNDVQGFQQLFRQRLQTFYDALGRMADRSDRSVNPRQPLEVGQVRRDRWVEAVDLNCRIIVCSGDENFGKPYALSVLHSNDLKVQNNRGQVDYDGYLCGQVQGGVKPSPVWIADLGEYQVVTVFGATQDPRKRYINELRQRTNRQNFVQIFPLQ